MQNTQSLLSLVKGQTYTYQAFRALQQELFDANRTSGPVQDEWLVAYSKANWQRWQRIEEKYEPSASLVEAMADVKRPLTWLLITEAWCGDAAQLTPFIGRVAAECDKIDLQIVLRDENLELMDQFLTNGGRAIPMLVVLDKETGELVGKWGPRPLALQEVVAQLKADGATKEDLIAKVQQWYAQDKLKNTEAELTVKLKEWGN